MSYIKGMLSKRLYWIFFSVLSVSVAIGTTTSRAENSDVSRAGPGIISASGRDTVGSARENTLINHTATRSSFAVHDENVASSRKAQPKTKRIILGAIMITIVAFIFINIISASNNLRICRTCGYTGTMKAVTLTDKPLFNSLLIALVTVFPVLLYYYSERGRFRCPVCGRTSMNVTIKSKLKVMNW